MGTRAISFWPRRTVRSMVFNSRSATESTGDLWPFPRRTRALARAKHHDALQHANRLQELVRFLELDLHATRRQSYAQIGRASCRDRRYCAGNRGAFKL